MAMHDEFAARVGIDWSDRKHDICLTPMPGGARQRSVLEHRPEVIDDWANGLRMRCGNRPVAVAVEQRKGLLIHALLKYAQLVVLSINPGLVAGLRRAFRPSRATDDPSDAALTLEIREQHPAQLRRRCPDDPRTRQRSRASTTSALRWPATSCNVGRRSGKRSAPVRRRCGPAAAATTCAVRRASPSGSRC